VEALERDVGNLLGLLRRGRPPWRSHCEEQELTLALGDASLQIHAANVSDLCTLAGDDTVSHQPAAVPVTSDSRPDRSRIGLRRICDLSGWP